MFRAFVDETGNDPLQFAFTFAAWVATVEEWERFSDDWATVLKSDPSIKYFKHSEAKARVGQFENWDQIACDQKILKLAEVIAKRDVVNLYGLLSGIRNDIITSIINRAVISPKLVRSILHANRSYDWCFHSIASLVIQRQIELGRIEKVDFVFDKGDAAFDDCVACYKSIIREPLFPEENRAVLGTLTEANDKDIVALQAADLLAGQATMKLRGFPIEEPYRVIAKGNRLLVCNIRPNDPVVRGLEDIIQQLNIVWSSRILERARGSQDEEE